MRFSVLLMSGLLVGLTACQPSGPPPSVALITPANDSVVSGTTATQMTLEDTNQQGEISVYARKRDSAEIGRLVGTVNTSPYILAWNTSEFPNGEALEVYATATVDGATGTSKPVRVTINNATAPNLSYLVAYNLPAGLSAQALQIKSATTIPALDVSRIRPDSTAVAQPVASPAIKLKTQAVAADRQLAVEWAWKVVDGAASYKILMSTKSVAGPYDLVRKSSGI